MFRTLLGGCRFSNWIYASKYDQMVNTIKGKLVLSPTVRDIGDVTLRMQQHMFSSDIILCEDSRHTNNLLFSLKNKLSYIDDTPAATDLVLSETSPPKSVSEELIQLSEHLRYNEEMYAMKKETFNSQEMVRQQNQIKKYNKRQFYKQQILDFKQQRGYGYVVDLQQERPDFVRYLTEGLNVMYLYPEGGNFIEWFLRTANQAQCPYEILPGPSQMISTLALTGFPADRFGIEYFPTDVTKSKLRQVLIVRKKQCFSVCIYEQLGNLEYILTQIQAVYGNHQMVFIKVEQDQEYLRQQIGSAIQFIKSRPVPTSRERLLKCQIVVAPYAIQYNSEFKETQFQKHYLNELIFDDGTTLYEVEKLVKKIEAYEQPKRYEIDSIKTARYLSDILPNQEDSLGVLKALLRIGDSEARRILLESSSLPNDVLQIQKR